VYRSCAHVLHRSHACVGSANRAPTTVTTAGGPLLITPTQPFPEQLTTHDRRHARLDDTHVGGGGAIVMACRPDGAEGGRARHQDRTAPRGSTTRMPDARRASYPKRTFPSTTDEEGHWNRSPTPNRSSPKRRRRDGREVHPHQPHDVLRFSMATKTPVMWCLS
jgi:hypothetical protein